MERQTSHLEWMDTMQRQVEEAARKHGWDWDDGDGYQRWQRSSMGSRYTTLQRKRTTDDGSDYGREFGYDEYQTVKVRISNHQTAYCSEDISLVPEPGPDDHAFAALEKILSGPFVES